MIGTITGRSVYIPLLLLHVFMCMVTASICHGLVRCSCSFDVYPLWADMPSMTNKHFLPSQGRIVLAE